MRNGRKSYREIATIEVLYYNGDSKQKHVARSGKNQRPSYTDCTTRYATENDTQRDRGLREEILIVQRPRGEEARRVSRKFDAVLSA
jgi:hypothetical protein